MSTEQPDPLAFASYELGELITKLLFYAEVNWCATPSAVSEAEQDERLVAVQTLNLVISKTQRIVTQLSGNVDQRRAAAKLTTALKQFAKDFRAVWNCEKRATLVDETRKIAWEHSQQRDVAFVKISPLLRLMKSVRGAVKGFVQSLNPAYQTCFRLSALLAAEIYPTIIGGQRMRDPETERAYLVVEFGGKLRSAIAAMSLKFPSLQSIPWDLDISGEINRLHGDFGRILQGPEQASPYLGVVLNRQLRQVGRYHRIVKLEDPVLWELLICIARNGAEFSSYETLANASRRAGLAIPTPHAVDGLIGDLRDVLRPLRVEIENRRNKGVRLVEKIQAAASQALPSTISPPEINDVHPPKPPVDPAEARIEAEHPQSASRDSADTHADSATLTPPSESNEDDLMRISDAAQTFDLYKGTVSRLLTDKKLKGNGKTGWSRRVSRASVKDYVAKRKSRPVVTAAASKNTPVPNAQAGKTWKCKKPGCDWTGPWRDTEKCPEEHTQGIEIVPPRCQR